MLFEVDFFHDNFCKIYLSRYYAAPSSVYNVSPYAATRLDNEEPSHIQHTLRRGNDEPEEDIETHHYIEILG